MNPGGVFLRVCRLSSSVRRDSQPHASSRSRSIRITLLIIIVIIAIIGQISSSRNKAWASV